MNFVFSNNDKTIIYNLVHSIKGWVFKFKPLQSQTVQLITCGKLFQFMLAKLVFKWVSVYIKQLIAQAKIFRKRLLGTVLPWTWHSARWSHDRWSFCWICWWLVQYFLFRNWNWEACSTCCLCRLGTNCCWWSPNWNISPLVPSRTAHHW